MHPYQQALAQLIDGNADITAAWIDHTTNPPTLRIRITPGDPRTAHPLRIPPSLAKLTQAIGYTPRLQILIAKHPTLRPQNSHQLCYNEPIPLGVQLQPKGQPWVGTAGAAVRFTADDGGDRWGILSNAHVMVPTNLQPAWPQHQPTDRRPPCAQLYRWQLPDEVGTHYCDAAVADALIDGYHTIAQNILDIPFLPQGFGHAQIDMDVIKSGRTTALTNGICIATGATVRVDYGEYIATLQDQDIFAALSGSFSAPGDSGSAIIDPNAKLIVSLLFAGNAELTVGCPMRHVAQELRLQPTF